MRGIVALFFVLVVTTGTASADWSSTWGKEGTEESGKKSPDAAAEDPGTRDKARETISGERPRDENVSPELPREALPQAGEQGGRDKE